FESEAAREAFLERNSRPQFRMSVEGFNPYRPEDEIRRELVNHFESCGEVFRVIVPTDPIVDRRAFVILFGHDAEEKALQLNGSDIGDWNALVKSAPMDQEDEYLMAQRYKKSLVDALVNDKKFKFGIAVWGYDTSLPEDEVESVLRRHFSSCGGITHVYIYGKRANIYFSEEHEETSALGLHRSEVSGFRITTRRLATARRNHSLAPGQSSRRIGYTRPAIMIEFAPEIGRKVKAFKKIKRIVKKKVMASRRMKEATTKEKFMPSSRMKEATKERVTAFLSPIILSPKD
ncbi:unnamed protein product, partial [Brassica rapa]